MGGDAGEQVLDERPADALNRQVVEWCEVAQAVFGDSHRLRPGTDAPCCSDHEPFEPRLRDVAEGLRWCLVEDAGLALALDVELEGLRVLVHGEGAGAVTVGGVSVANFVTAFAFRRPVRVDGGHVSPSSAWVESVRAYAVPALLEPASHFGLVEEAAAFDFVGGELAAGGEPVDLFGLAAEHGGELVDGEEGR